MIDSFEIDIKVRRIKRFGNTVMALLGVPREMTYMTCSDCGCRTQVPLNRTDLGLYIARNGYQGNKPVR